MANIRQLKPKEISCRVQQISEKGLSLLLYVTSRAGQNLLDEIYGPLGWQRTHTIIGNELYCTISVWDDNKKLWVNKQDVGKESFTEKEKGRASDSFKRACVNFGIGRELYSAPYIWISSEAVTLKEVKSKNGDIKYTTYDKFSVKSIIYNDMNEIDSIEIINQKLETVFKKWPTELIGKAKILTIEKQLERTGIDIKKILDMCGVNSIDRIEEADYSNVYKKLLASPDKEVS
jgi:hypothetical protein